MQRTSRSFHSLKGYFLTAIKGVPFSLWPFPLGRFLHNGTGDSIDAVPSSCVQHEGSIDVLVSMYRPLNYRKTFEASINSCAGNEKIRFRILLIDPSAQELTWAQALVEGTVHSLEVSTEKLGIYETWNKLVDSGRSALLSNVNVDDLRLPHSLCRQAQFMEQELVDISYGDFYVSTTPWTTRLELPKWKSNLPELDLKTLLVQSLNLAHCSPMWTRDVMTDVGMFDENFVSSGDSEYWLRCLVNGKRFGKFRQPTVVYFHNPQGLSSSIRSKGRAEWGAIRKSYLNSGP